eukprot:700302-Rhodomonas_salina.2
MHTLGTAIKEQYAALERPGTFVPGTWVPGYLGTRVPGTPVPKDPLFKTGTRVPGYPGYASIT